MAGPLIILFFVIRYLRKTLPEDSVLRKWDKTWLRVLYAIPVLLIVDFAFLPESVSNWAGHFILLGVVITAYLHEDFRQYRNFIVAFVPFVIISFLLHISKSGVFEFLYRIRALLGVLFPVSIVWMIVHLVIANKQRRALLKERNERLKEEQLNHEIAARKEELENMVAIRTSELVEEKEKLEQTLTELKITQAQLIQREKMASLGELTAGIAHEIQNPLNFVNNFSELSVELLDEQKHLIKQDKHEEAILIANTIRSNLEKVVHHGKRADSIVKGMLEHSRTAKGEKQLTDLNLLTDEYLKLAYHGMRAKNKSFHTIMETHYASNLEKVYVVPQEMGRVLLNLFNNAFYAVEEMQKNSAPGYQPTLSVCTERVDTLIRIIIKDNGTGIPKPSMHKVFQPFFTTKPAGQGTGLGLSISYDIVKAHGGDIKVETEQGKGTVFTIELPLYKEAIIS
jgi:two-component system, NtrC family, sensor kinase